MPDTAWRAVSLRDRHFDGQFVYVALTTNIYCRPSCPARLPRRRDVLILPTATEAERQGYTACRRCRPDRDAPAPAEQSIHAALRFIDEHLGEAITLTTLAKVSRLSPNHLQRVFSRIVGLSPKNFADFRRLVRLKELLRTGMSVSNASYEAGYGSTRALYEKASRRLGMTPATYVRGGAGLTIRCALAEVSLGRLLLATTDVGLCALVFGTRDEGVLAKASGEFPHATLVREATLRPDWKTALSKAEREDPLLLRLPLKTRRDVFQANVWKALSW